MKIEQLDTDRTSMQNVKQRFFALRNGIVADALRKSGSTYRIIFGLTLPQLKEIAAAFGFNHELADELWHNTSTRESRLLAPMLYDPKSITLEKVRELLKELTGNVEEIDVLCTSLLRKTPVYSSLIEELKDAPDALMRYTALRLLFNRLTSHPGEVLQIAKTEISRNEPLTRIIAWQLKNEAEYVCGGE